MEKINLKELDLIGISGPIGAGKDTVARWIKDAGRYSERSTIHWQIVQFAYPLKKACSDIFGWSMEEIEDRQFKEAVDPRYGVSPRKAMQLLGTEYGRVMIRDDLWIRVADAKAQDGLNRGFKTVIPDVRFPNEDEYVRSRPNSLRVFVLPSKEAKVTVSSNHASEQGLSPTSNDLIIVNYKDGLESLYAQLSETFIH
jgi:hypothetical protein